MKKIKKNQNNKLKEGVQNMSIDFKKYLNCYEFETVLPGSKELVKFKPITTKQMKKLLTYENESRPEVIEKALDELIYTSVTSENFNIYDLYTQDRFHLLVELRKKTKGSSYQFEFTCPDCKSQSLQTVDLNNLKVKDMPEVSDRKVKLTEDISITLDYITRGKQAEALRLVSSLSNLSDTQRSAETMTYLYALSIRTVITPEGEITDMSLEDKIFLLENISKDGYDKIKEWYESNDFGVEFKYNMKCIHSTDGKPCTFSKTLDIPVDNFFF